jgi:hypothetical protein
MMLEELLLASTWTIEQVSLVHWHRQWIAVEACALEEMAVAAFHNHRPKPCQLALL